MSYEMHRVFCATPGDTEEQREQFYEVIGEFNGEVAMARNVLLVAVSIVPTMFDKRPYQKAVDDNIRACRYYIQVLDDTWGRYEKNFERDYRLAMECAADPNLPMAEVAVLFQDRTDGRPPEPAVAEFRRELSEGKGPRYASFSNREEYRERLWAFFAGWLETVAPAAAAGA